VPVLLEIVGMPPAPESPSTTSGLAMVAGPYGLGATAMRTVSPAAARAVACGIVANGKALEPSCWLGAMVTAPFTYQVWRSATVITAVSAGPATVIAMIETLPFATAVTIPSVSTVATPGLLLDQASPCAAVGMPVESSALGMS